MDEGPNAGEGLAGLSARDVRQITHALLRGWVPVVAESPRGAFVDFHVTALLPLGLRHELRFRLFTDVATAADVTHLREEAAAQHLAPVIVAPRGLAAAVVVPPDIGVIRPQDFARLCQESGLLDRDAAGRVCVDRAALSALTDRSDVTLALVNGLLWLRTLSRDRLPPPLHGLGVPAHELFERCFYLVMTTTFRAGGVSWGTRTRGR